MVQFWWQGTQFTKPLRLHDAVEAERIRSRVEIAIDGLKRGRFPRVSQLLAGGHGVLDVIFPNETTTHLLDGETVADDGNPLRVSQLAEQYVRHLGISESDGDRRRVASELKHLVEITGDARVVGLDADGFDDYVQRRPVVRVLGDPA